MEIIDPAGKIEVIESTKQCKPGSIGYLTFQTPVEPYNIWNTHIIFTKFGKKGKDRIEVAELDTEMVDIDKMTEISAEGRELVKTAAAKVGFLPRSANYIMGAKIERALMGSKNVINLELYDFLGYISSLSMFTNYIMHGYQRYNREFYARRDLNRIPISDIEPEMLGHYICWVVGGKKNEGTVIREVYLDYFRNSHNRTNWMHKLYRSLSLLQRGVHRYSEIVKAAHSNMQRRITEAAAYCKRQKGKPQKEDAMYYYHQGDKKTPARPEKVKVTVRADGLEEAVEPRLGESIDSLPVIQ